MSTSIATPPSLDDICACPVCDALWRDRAPRAGERVRCRRCRAVLRTGRPEGFDRVLAIALATPVLMLVGVTASFLTLSGGGARLESSVLDAAMAVATDDTWALAVAVGALIVALPAARALALVYVLLPLRLGRPAARRAAEAFRFAIEIRPWSMAEIFVIGVAVALVKVSGLASVALGPAFWSFTALAALTLIEDAALCERSIWARIG